MASNGMVMLNGVLLNVQALQAKLVGAAAVMRGLWKHGNGDCNAAGAAGH